MQKISLEDAQHAVDFADLLDYARNGNQADDENPIVLASRNNPNAFSIDSEIIAKRLGFDSYDSMPSGTKSFISHCAALAKKYKKQKPPRIVSFPNILREEYEKIEPKNGDRPVIHLTPDG